MRLTSEQMLALWRRAQGYEAARTDCAVEIFEGQDLTAQWLTAMRNWYLELLDTGDLRYLTLTDIAPRLAFAPAAPGGVWTAHLPVDVRRVVSLQVAGAQMPTVIGTDARRMALNANRYGRSSQLMPTAAVTGRDLTLWCCTDNGYQPQITNVMAVTDPGEDFYDFDESALSLISPVLSN